MKRALVILVLIAATSCASDKYLIKTEPEKNPTVLKALDTLEKESNSVFVYDFNKQELATVNLAYDGVGDVSKHLKEILPKDYTYIRVNNVYRICHLKSATTMEQGAKPGERTAKPRSDKDGASQPSQPVAETVNAAAAEPFVQNLPAADVVPAGYVFVQYLGEKLDTVGEVILNVCDVERKRFLFVQSTRTAKAGELRENGQKGKNLVLQPTDKVSGPYGVTVNRLVYFRAEELSSLGKGPWMLLSNLDGFGYHQMRAGPVGAVVVAPKPLSEPPEPSTSPPVNGEESKLEKIYEPSTDSTKPRSETPKPKAKVGKSPASGSDDAADNRRVRLESLLRVIEEERAKFEKK